MLLIIGAAKRTKQVVLIQTNQESISPKGEKGSFYTFIHLKIIFGSDKSEPIHDSSRQDQGKKKSIMSHILGARLVPNEQHDLDLLFVQFGRS
nr:hypothetical protein Q903MT_gene3652 [Picea sitchensis]